MQIVESLLYNVDTFISLFSRVHQMLLGNMGYALNC